MKLKKDKLKRLELTRWIKLFRESENPGLNQEEGLVNVDDTLEEEDGERAGDITIIDLTMSPAPPR